MHNNILVEKFLSEEFGLSKREINLYLNLIKYGATTILELSEISNINRVTTHVNIENLTQKGLVTQIKKGRGSRRLIMAESPEKLSVILQERKAKLEAAEKQLDFIAGKIIGLKKEYKQNDRTEIRHYTGKEEVKLIYDEILKANEIRTYANTADILQIFPGNVKRFVDAHKKNKNMYIWEIITDSEQTQSYIQQMDPKRFFYRLVIKQSSQPVDYLIFDGKIAMIEADRNNISGIIIGSV